MTTYFCAVEHPECPCVSPQGICLVCGWDFEKIYHTAEQSNAAKLAALQKSLHAEYEKRAQLVEVKQIKTDRRQADQFFFTAWKAPETDLAERLEAYNKALLCDPQHFLALVFRGNLYAIQGQYEYALHDYQKAVSLRPDHYYGQGCYGEALLALGHLDAAENALTQALTLNPNYSRAYLNKMLVSLHQAQYQQAWQECTKWLDFVKESTLGYLYRSWIGFLLHHDQAVTENLNLACQTAPQQQNLLNDWLKDWLETAQLYHPHPVIVHYVRGWLYYLSDQPEKAEADFTQGLKCIPNHTLLTYSLACIQA